MSLGGQGEVKLLRWRGGMVYSSGVREMEGKAKLGWFWWSNGLTPFIIKGGFGLG